MWEIANAGCTAADIDEQVEIPRALDGTRMALLFTEGNRGWVRINFRGKGGIGVLDLAKSLGGGGHYEAAGAILEGTVEEVVTRVLPVAEQYLDQLQTSKSRNVQKSKPH